MLLLISIGILISAREWASSWVRGTPFPSPGQRSAARAPPGAAREPGGPGARRRRKRAPTPGPAARKVPHVAHCVKQRAHSRSARGTSPLFIAMEGAAMNRRSDWEAFA